MDGSSPRAGIPSPYGCGTWNLRDLLATRNIFDVQFDPDGQKLATIAADASTRIWDLREAGSSDKPGTAAHPLVPPRGAPDGASVGTAKSAARFPNPLFTRITGVPGRPTDSPWTSVPTETGPFREPTPAGLAWDLTRQRVGPIPGLSPGVNSLRVSIPGSCACFSSDPGDWNRSICRCRIATELPRPGGPQPGSRPRQSRLRTGPGHGLGWQPAVAIVADRGRHLGAGATRQRRTDSGGAPAASSTSPAAPGTGTIGLSPDGTWLAVGADVKPRHPPVRYADRKAPGTHRRRVRRRPVQSDGRRFLAATPQHVPVVSDGNMDPDLDACGGIRSSRSPVRRPCLSSAPKWRSCRPREAWIPSTAKPDAVSDD